MAQIDYVFGIHAVDALLQQRPEQVRELLLLGQRRDQRMQSLEQTAASLGIRVKRLQKDAFDRTRQSWGLPEQGIQGVMAVCVSMKVHREDDWPDILQAVLDRGQVPLILVLDGVTDPHNLGACLRSAEAAGVQLVLAPKDKSAPLSAAAIKVACGAADFVPYVQITNLARTLKQLQEMGIWVYGAAGEAEVTHYQQDLRGAVALVLGAEGDGLRRLTRENCDGLIKIPMLGQVSSLNVSVATGVMLFEAVRQRLQKP